MSLKWAGQSLFWILLAVGAVASMPAHAQDNNEPINRPTVADKIDDTTAFHKYQTSIVDDAKWMVGVDYGDKRVENITYRFERLYDDLWRQQSESHDIIRTQDMPSPFNTSLSNLKP